MLEGLPYVAMLLLLLLVLLARIIHDSCPRRRKCWQSLGFGRC